jgi:hypothetical protein
VDVEAAVAGAVEHGQVSNRSHSGRNGHPKSVLPCRLAARDKFDAYLIAFALLIGSFSSLSCFPSVCSCTFSYAVSATRAFLCGQHCSRTVLSVPSKPLLVVCDCAVCILCGGGCTVAVLEHRRHGSKQLIWVKSLNRRIAR